MQKEKKNFRKLFFWILAICLSSCFLFCKNKCALAQDAPVWGENNEAAVAMEKTGLSKTDPRIIIVNIIRIFLGFLGIVLLILIMYAGFLWMTAGGEEEKISQSKIILKNSLIGLLIILSSYAIVSFILRMLGAGGGGGRMTGEPVPSVYSYLGAASDHIVESHYPARGQKDVPKNTNIVVTFREEMVINSIIYAADKKGEVCGQEGKEKCINSKNIRIFKTSDGEGCLTDDSCASIVLDATATTTNNKIFVFNPSKHLNGSEAGEEYKVYLGNGLKKKNGDNAFSAVDNYQWTFFVSNNLDLDPPVVQSIFPFPDQSADGKEIDFEGVNATWELEVSGMPKFKQDAAIGIVEFSNKGSWERDDEAFVRGDYNSTADAYFEILIHQDENNSNILKAQITLTDDVIADKTVIDDRVNDFFQGLSFEREDMAAENLWRFNIDGKVEGDWFIINNKKYVFGEDIKKDEGDSTEELAIKIKDKIDQRQNYEIAAAVDNSKVILTAVMASADANNWDMDASDSAISLSSGMAGVDKTQGVVIQKGGREDWPINAVIQINFNEAIDPISANYFIKITEKAAGSAPAELAGEFLFSNQYKTVEFKPAEPCGYNSCGEPRFCLPKKKQLIIKLQAGELAAKCEDAGGCSSYDNFINCNSTGSNVKICQNGENENYPEAEFNTGIMDMCMNSLDGNKNENAEGPGSGNTNNQSGKAPFNENDMMAICAKGNMESICTSVDKTECGAVDGCKYHSAQPVQDKTVRMQALQGTEGDDYEWSFYTSDEVRQSAPYITLRTPNQGSVGVDKSTQLTAKFDYLMMSSSLKSDSVDIIDKDGNVSTHNCVRLNPKMVNVSADKKEASAAFVSYWVEKKDADNEPDGYPDNTEVIIKHGDFDLESSYEGDIGSGVKDIFQNCYNPSKGPCPWDETTLCQGCDSGICDCPSETVECQSKKCQKCADSGGECCVVE